MRRDKETLALVASLLILTSVFTFSLYTYMNPPKKVWEVTIFEVVARPGHTYVAGYGDGYLRIKGSYEFEEGATYRITYISTKRNWAERVISIEKIG